MTTSDEPFARILFEIAASTLGEEEYRKAMDFLDNVSASEEKKHKAECEEPLKALLAELASFPDTTMISRLHDAVMRKPFIVRAYFVCWLGESGDDLKNMKGVILPSDLTLQMTLNYLLELKRPFWR